MAAARSVAAFHQANGTAEEILRQTQVDVDVPLSPTIVGPKFSGLNSSGVALMTQREKFNRQTLANVLEKLGLSANPAPGEIAANSGPKDWREGIDEAMTREVVSALDLKQTTPFNAQQAAPIFNWIMHARNIEQWTPAPMALLRRIVNDRRLRAPTVFDQIFERHPEVTRALLPDILGLIEQEGLGPDYTPARQAAYTFPRLDPALLKPHAAQIIALLGRDQATHDILLPAVGRLGVDPRPYLLPFEDDATNSQFNFQPRARAACYAEKQWASVLIDPLRRAIEAAPRKSRLRRDIWGALLGALAHLGNSEFVDQWLAQRDDAESKRLRNEIQRRLADKRSPDAVCSLM